MVKKPLLIAIVGPTASGKTDVAIRLAKQFNTEIISADSRQFYKEIPLGTAAPDIHQLAEVKHHFIGHLSIFDDYNVARYEKEVLNLLNEKFTQMPVMIMVGGSGLYIDAVCKGIDDLPDPDEQLRKDLDEKLQKQGIEILQQELKLLDPEYYKVVDLKNPKRLIRALEICLQTGKKYSDLRQNRPAKRNFNILKIGLKTDRKTLFERIEKRTDNMMKNGWLEEAKSVYPYRNLNSLNTVGYKELFKYLEGEWNLEFAVEKIKTNTRRYAKRQITWFNKDKDIFWFPNIQSTNLVNFLTEYLKKL